MRPIPPDLAAHLGGGVSTLARCWTLTRRDGVAMGFTDHDADLTFDGVTHLARSGLEASETEAELGFSVASADVAGVLNAASLTEQDIARGLYDGAEVVVHLVNWADPAVRIRLDTMQIGEIRRTDSSFVAEMRNAAHRFDEERGRLYTARCAADLGDSRCTKPISAATSAVSAVSGRSTVNLGGLGAHPSGWFDGGRLVFTSGANVGWEVEIRHHRSAGALAAVDLWLEAPRPISVGDTVVLTPGCDKSFATCRAKFANTANFQGFPHIPGNDFLVQIAGIDQAQRFDGGSLFR
jgi:uncharacterized phage protein (TIGR02218 family)